VNHSPTTAPLPRAARARRLVLATLAVTACAGLAACGSDEEEATSAAAPTTTAAAADAPGLAEAKTVGEKYLARPTQIQVTEPVGKPIPKGKTVYFVHCGVTACNVMGDSMAKAAKVLGWNFKVINTKGTPEGVKAAWSQAVRDKVDGVIGNGFPVALFAPQLKQLKAAGTPVVLASVTDPAENGVEVVLSDPEESANIGEAMAARAVTAGGGKSNILYVNLPDYPILVEMSKRFEADTKRWCPDCEFAKMDLPLTAIGTDATNRIVSYLRSHPKVDVVTIGQAQVTIGLPAALKAAGLGGKVKIIDESPGSESYQYLKSGEQDATVVYPYQEVSWGLMDGLARKFTGQSAVAGENNLPWWLATEGNLPESVDAPSVVEFESQFKKVWGVQ
jgi:ABC-type sugar transport system substrate-binding protein